MLNKCREGRDGTPPGGKAKLEPQIDRRGPRECKFYYTLMLILHVVCD